MMNEQGFWQMAVKLLKERDKRNQILTSHYVYTQGLVTPYILGLDVSVASETKYLVSAGIINTCCKSWRSRDKMCHINVCDSVALYSQLCNQWRHLKTINVSCLDLNDQWLDDITNLHFYLV